MARHVVLLRGINLGPRNRIPMAELRGRLEAAGFGEVRTLLQSGNVVVAADGRPERTARRVEEAIRDGFGLDVAAVVRTSGELAAVVRRNPLADVATDPRRYQVSFLAAPLPPDLVDRLEATATGGERLVVVGREAYAWHPAGIGRSKLWSALAAKSLGVTATARNWATVTKLLELAEE